MNRVVKLCLAGSLVLAILGIPALSLGPETAGAQACVPSGASPSDPYPGTTAAASSFESGTLDGFVVSKSGTGEASVSAGVVALRKLCRRPAHHHGARLPRQGDSGSDAGRHRGVCRRLVQHRRRRDGGE